MTTPTLGIIRVLTTSDTALLNEHGKLLQASYGLNSISRCIPDQPNGIFDDASEALAIPKIIELGQELVEQGCRALFLSCAADPGLEALRAAVPVPVIGAGSASAGVARLLGLPVAVLGIGAQAPQPFRTLLGENVPYARPEGVTCTTDLLKPEGMRSVVDCVRQLQAAGARVIAFSCTGLSTIGAASVLQRELDCVAVDAVQAAGLFASQLLSSSRAA